MQESNKILQSLGIPHSALLSVIFGMMLLSFPMGLFVVFNTDLGSDINFDYPLFELSSFSGLDLSLPFAVTIGDAFVLLWSLYAILFAMSIFGPKNGFLQTLSPLLSSGKTVSDSNYLVSITKWFSILILVSAIVTLTQEGFGIETLPPPADNDLEQFLLVTLAPLAEEIGFRALLIGIPVFALYAHKFSAKYFFKSLWNPNANLHVYDSKKALVLIVLVGILFGFAHIATGEPWSEGKFAQASASGIILGWLYFRFGLLPAIVVHWGTNYFIFSYAHFVSQINEISVDEAFYHPLLNSMEVIFLISGVVSLTLLILTYFNSKKKSQLEI
ncbi:CPBP family intramembrane metalloprotease [Nitrosopumilus sp. K4]|uniref:CPBP family intramembrane glutamic endopeptidase n=1 Tax=Nitrosopumilus sp. K4 TaxID=2795383 RepID=UPI001BA70030|nr:CPBP family intramembrane glutamic endopeptidase [Nitrosopumilus sp. K4]QUC63875.1 CPBP family intramembrane metalloprotease [Nitrosopumilus sp. K4]